MKAHILRYSALLTMSIVSVHASAQAHAFTVADDIEMERFSDPRPLPGVSSSEVARSSPNRKWAAIVTTKGIIRTNKIESRIVVFDMRQVKAFLELVIGPSPQPRAVAKITSFPHHYEPTGYAPVITDLRWSPDSTYIYFRGEDLQGTHRLYRVKENGKELRCLTPTGYDVRRYSIARDTVVYKARSGVAAESTIDNSRNPDAEAVTGHSLSEILFPHQESYDLPKTWRLWTLRKVKGMNRRASVVGYSSRELEVIPALFEPFVISPRGDKLIELTPVVRLPTSWESYKPAKGFEHLKLRSDEPRLLGAEYALRPKAYTLIDLASGKQTSLLEAPSGGSLGYSDPNQVIWSDDGQRVLVTNTFLPLDRGSVRDDPRHLEPCFVASVDLPSLEAHCVIFNEHGLRWYVGEGFDMDNLSFGGNNNDIDWQAGISPQTTLSEKFHFQNGAWILSQSASIDTSRKRPATMEVKNESESMDLRLKVNQSLNEPPTLWVEDKHTGAGKKLWDPNPQLAHVRFGEVSVLRWKDKNGHEWSGGLIKPADYVPGKRYPLVLQMYVFDNDQFMTDGTMPTAFAARHLASAGMMVLQIQKDMVHTMDDAEAQEHLEGYRSAIEKLSREGLIDPGRVGVVGFSWTCWYVENALIKAPGLFRAATIADGPDHSYMQYHLFDETDLLNQEQDERVIGAKPIGDGLKRWLEIAPGFALDRVQTPLRIEAIRPMSILDEWEIYSSLRMQGKAVDLIYFPTSWHIHQKPLARLESQQGDVDWFRFWLQGYVDPDSAKKSQYERWESLRSGQAVKRAGKP